MRYPKYGTKLIDRTRYFKDVYFNEFREVTGSDGYIILDYIFKDGSKWRQDLTYIKPDEYEERFKEEA